MVLDSGKPTDVQPLIEHMGDIVDDLLRSADNSDFKPCGSGDDAYWEFAKRITDSKMDVFVLVKVKR